MPVPFPPLMENNIKSLDGRLLFAVPKKGRLLESTLELLKGSDIKFHRHSRLDIALCINLPIALVFLPAADIPRFVGEGRVDLGITGQDQVAESNTEVHVDEVLNLGFGKCRLQVQAPAKGEINDPLQLVGKNVVTSFTELATAYFAKLEEEVLNTKDGQARLKDVPVDSKTGLKTKIKYVGGSVEASCALGLADGIVDLVESGETMKAAGLKAISTVMETGAVMICSKKPSNPALVAKITSRISGVITAQRYVLCTYNVPRSKMDTCKNITPGKRAPTVQSLDEEGWVAISVMVEKKKIATVMDELEAVGASDILVMTISNSRAG